ncbi:MAG: FxDxF family PEP-CTERM protein [Pseudomonadota bacterium]
MKYVRLCAALAACCASTLAAAATPVANSYDMLNGNTGSYHYWDDTYTGAGCVTCDNASLSGGLGQLTDGIVASDNWFVTEAPGHGPYVGWTIDPTIKFHFNASTNVDTVKIHFDDADGAGGVSAPSAVIINGNTYTVADPAGSAPFWFTANGVGFTGNDLNVTFVRQNAWVFASEVQFANAVPEPETYAMMLAGMALVGVAARRRR